MTTITDTFNRANSFGSLGTTSDGTKTWTVAAGSWDIISNQVKLDSAITNSAAWIDGTTADGTVQITAATLEASNGIGPLFRFSDTSNYWFVSAKSGASASFLVKRSGGTNSSIGSGFTVAAGDTVTVIGAGASITVKVNGTTVASTSDSLNQTATKHGLYMNNTTSAALDNFSFVTAAAAVARAPSVRVVSRAVARAAVI